jgi:hypothetical protein
MSKNGKKTTLTYQRYPDPTKQKIGFGDREKLFWRNVRNEFGIP